MHQPFVRKRTNKKSKTQYGYILVGDYYVTVDPIGDIVSALESVYWKFSRKSGGYQHDVWHKWDSFYRVKLGVQHFFYKLESKMNGD